MQTFLPYPDFTLSAKVLDRQRLGKQRVEVMQILKALDMNEDAGWGNHPATLMWSGWAYVLADYGLEICTEWCRRGYTDTCYEKIEDRREKGKFAIAGISDMPLWWGDKAFHDSHKSNLVRKDPEYYRAFFPDVPDNLEYVWPARVV